MKFAPQPLGSQLLHGSVYRPHTLAGSSVISWTNRHQRRGCFMRKIEDLALGTGRKNIPQKRFPINASSLFVYNDNRILNRTAFFLLGELDMTTIIPWTYLPIRPNPKTEELHFSRFRLRREKRLICFRRA